MADNPTPNFGGQPPVGSPYGQWTPPQTKSRPGGWLAIALAVTATVVAVGALIVALTRPAPVESKTTAPTYSPDEASTAHQKLCDAYKLASRAVQIETNGTNQAFAGIATVNGALMLEEAANASPALALSERTTALALAESYSNVAATSSMAGGQDPAWQAALNDANAKDAAMKKVCGGG